jgi:hypothetical protein
MKRSRTVLVKELEKQEEGKKHGRMAKGGHGLASARHAQPLYAMHAVTPETALWLIQG